ncbi:hypothetical protein GCM10023168_15030 [Fodinibacter luteus]|uniref:Uncharacterized protein n=1 Tax=Fodinibacter luteus TaxID=552064 RepID=A0ABP8KBP2_9MICO
MTVRALRRSPGGTRGNITVAPLVYPVRLPRSSDSLDGGSKAGGGSQAGDVIE